MCSSATISDCVPICNETHHGYELLATIDGMDTKLSCNLAHGLHSWVGLASEGGYLGVDVQSFCSSVSSGAAGSYVLTLSRDAGTSADLIIRPGQRVHINCVGSSSSWGSGGFTVQQGGSLSLVGVSTTGSIVVQDGGSLTMNSGTMSGNGTLYVEPHANHVAVDNMNYHGHDLTGSTSSSLPLLEGHLVFNTQCFQPYTSLSDSWRSPGTATDQHYCDIASYPSDPQISPTGVGGGRWYRFTGGGGDALPLTSPGARHCGVSLPGWLSGWDSRTDGYMGTDGIMGGISGRTDSQHQTYSGRGRYPTAAEGVVERTVCFDAGYGQTCNHHVSSVGVVHCGSFFLWRLPYMPTCGLGYCTVPSGLH
jgi:hypothetical protein